MSGNDVVWMLGVLLVAVGVWGVLDYQGTRKIFRAQKDMFDLLSSSLVPLSSYKAAVFYLRDLDREAVAISANALMALDDEISVAMGKSVLGLLKLFDDEDEDREWEGDDVEIGTVGMGWLLIAFSVVSFVAWFLGDFISGRRMRRNHDALMQTLDDSSVPLMNHMMAVYPLRQHDRTELIEAAGVLAGRGDGAGAAISKTVLALVALFDKEAKEEEL